MNSMHHIQRRPDVFRSRGEIQEFFVRQGIRYLSRTRVVWKPLLALDLYASPYYLENKAFFEGLCLRYGDRIASGDLAQLYIRKVNDDVGYGVFAAEHIRDTQFIGVYTGVVQPEAPGTGAPEQNGGYESDYSWYYPDTVPSAPPLEINGRWEGNELRFVNHGQAPNVVVEHTLHQGQWHIFFRAGRDIDADEQLLIDYGEAYWEDGFRDKKNIADSGSGDFV